jgi:Ca-activated chloride channel family protein
MQRMAMASAPMRRMADCESAPAACAPPGAPSSSSSSAAGAAASGGGARTTGASVKYWTPDTPYLRVIKEGNNTSEQYARYIAQRAEGYAKTPAFYFDCASFFLNPAQLDATRRDIGIRILSNISELSLDNSRILRVLGYKLFEAREYSLATEVFCQVARWRPHEAQSYRDLGLTMLERGGGWYQTAVELLWRTCTMVVPDDFSEIEIEAIWELRDCLARAGREGVKVVLPGTLRDVAKEFLEPDMPLDLRVTMAWDTDNVDIDLHVVEPTGEEAYYGHKETRIGGLNSRDFRRGYGPEGYVLKRAYPGTYKIKTNYFSSHQASLTGPTTVILSITTNFGRENQKTATTLVRLNESKDNGEIGSVTIG